MTHNLRASMPTWEGKPLNSYEYMEIQHKSFFNDLLLNKKQEIYNIIKAGEQSLSEPCHNYSDAVDTASQSENFEQLLNSRKLNLSRIQDINNAINAVSNDEYGFCQSCGIEIGVGRLLANPTALLCVDCQSIKEFQQSSPKGLVRL